MSQIKKEVKRFLLVGFSAVSTDLVTYYLLINFLSHTSAKSISFLLGTIVAYILNKYWTFEKHERNYKEIAEFTLLYTITLGANVLVNQLVLDYTNIVFLSFLIATAVSTVLNFIGQKWWVFK